MDMSLLDQPKMSPELTTKGNPKTMARIYLNKDDDNLLLYLHDLIYVDIPFIQRYIYTKYEREIVVRSRLRKLEEAGFVKSFSSYIHDGERVSKIYTLALPGMERVEQLQGFHHWNQRWTRKLMPWYQHQLMLNDIYMQLRQHLEAQGVVIVDFVPEPRAFYQYSQSKTDVVQPDGILVLREEGKTDTMGIFLELERSVTKRKNTLQKVRRYNDFFQREASIHAAYDEVVGFEEPVDDWIVLFIGRDPAGKDKVVRDLTLKKDETLTIPVVAVTKDDLIERPFDAVYQLITGPDPQEKVRIFSST